MKKRRYFYVLLIISALLLNFVSPFSFVGNEIVSQAATNYDNVIDFQQARWQEIMDSVFGAGTITAGDVPDTVPDVQSGSSYFGWKLFEDSDGVTPWDGTASQPVSYSDIITYAGDSVQNGADGSTITAASVNVTYTVYEVSNASELYWVMTKQSNTASNVLIDLVNDIDLNGAEQSWKSLDVSTAGWLYIRGNGHCIYNLRCDDGTTNSRGFLGKVTTKKLIIDNVDFSNCITFENIYAMNTYAGVVIGWLKNCAYLHNVNIRDSLVYSCYSNVGTLIGRTELATGNVFINNCSSVNCYVYGTDHVGGLTGCQHNTGTAYKIKYNAAFPDSPETWMNYGNYVFPEMVENTYSVDCEVFSTGDEGDSGAFISCGGKFIARNCFTNNIVYGIYKTGAFIGRIVTPQSLTNGMYDDAGQKRVEAYFENCYASGSVEGTERIGGFVALSDGVSSANGICVYNNCYTTAMVGMDYAGEQLGGFVGTENSYANQKATIIYEGETVSGNGGDVYINCYAAGEVGNILADTSVESTGTYQYLGGFTGYSTNSYGNYINCYYDKQTTAMRERACGSKDNFSKLGAASSQIPGVSGVYTLSSETKSVAGLADTENLLGDDSIWGYETGYYPQLLVFSDLEKAEENFGADKAEFVRNYSKASVATVFLDHYDTVLNESGEEELASVSVYDTVRDITKKFDFSSDSQDLTWEIDTQRNAVSGFVSKLGGEDGTGFTMTFQTGEDEGEVITRNYNPSVLTIAKVDGVYKCLDFAPGKQWVKVTIGDGDTAGVRRLRLLPDAYLNAGSVINVDVSETADDLLANSVYIIDSSDNSRTDMDGFYHDVTVAYALTDKTRLATYDIYSGQNLNEYNSGDTQSFALYGGYLLDGSSTGVGLNDDGRMYDQKFTVTNQENVSGSGMTMVKIYKTEFMSEDGSKSTLAKTEPVDLSDETTKAKWEGTQLFDTNDIGYYYMVYYWRLNDGRYLEDTKLVRITADSYSVEIITGILGAEHTVSANGDKKTSIDQYITDNVSSDGSWDTTFPSAEDDFADDEDILNGYYNAGYNEVREYNGDLYYIKSMKKETTELETVVGWYRDIDYILTTLIIEARDENGEWHEMARVSDEDSDNVFDFVNSTYSYTYYGYTVSQDPVTKLFEVTQSDEQTKQFKVESATGDISALEYYIKFSFMSSGMAYVQDVDDLRITALFRTSIADIQGQKSVLLEQELSDEKRDEEASLKETLGVEAVDGYKEVDNADVTTDEERKAVACGDVLTYRVKLHNTGYLNSAQVNVFDTVPSGCTYLEGSQKAYKQKKTIDSGTISYGEITDLAADANVSMLVSEDGTELEWHFNDMNILYDYYVEYQVRVDDISAVKNTELLTNTATWNFKSLSGTVENEFYNEDEDEIAIDSYKRYAIFDIDSEIFDLDDSGEHRQYTITFKQNITDDKYVITKFDNKYPTGFTPDEGEDAILILKDTGDGYERVYDSEIEVVRTDLGFSISGLSLEPGEQYKVVFTGTQQQLGSDSDGNVLMEIKNEASLLYTREGEDINTVLANVVTKTERITNEVETDAAWMYLNIEKQIPVEDYSQSFLFRIDFYSTMDTSGEPEKVYYTDLRCTSPLYDSAGEVSGYSGTKLVKMAKRGFYKITEVTDWSETDYDFEYDDFIDSEISVAGCEWAYQSNISPDDASVTIELPRAMYESSAFPAILTNCSDFYPTVLFSSKESLYAYLSGQSYAGNSIY